MIRLISQAIYPFQIQYFPFPVPAPIQTETPLPTDSHAFFSLAFSLDQGRLWSAVSTSSSPLSSSPPYFLGPVRSSSSGNAFICTSNLTWGSCSVWTSKSTFGLLFLWTNTPNNSYYCFIYFSLAWLSLCTLSRTFLAVIFCEESLLTVSLNSFLCPFTNPHSLDPPDLSNQPNSAYQLPSPFQVSHIP